MPQPSTIDETFACELTPQGRGAVAVVVVAGPDATRIVDELFVPASGPPLADSPIGRVRFGHWGGTDGEELVVCRSAENQLEVHCHGGVAAVESVLRALVARGCRRLTWPEWLRHTAADPILSAAQIALANAPTARTAAILLDQYNGALSQAIESVLADADAGDWRRAAECIDAVLAFRDVGHHLTAPWRVVLAGPPNVGKSSLINALAGFERAIVSPMPGTTRDVVTTLTAIDGWPVELADTAGLRVAEDDIESAGVALTGGALAAADLVLLVHDASAADELQPDMPETVLHLLARKRFIHVWNKIDLVSGGRQLSDRPGNLAVVTSATTGQGIPALIAAIGQALVPHPPPSGAAVPFALSHLAALDAARISIADRDAAEVRRVLQPLLAK